MNLAQQALSSCDGVMQAIDQLQGRMLEFCGREKMEELKTEFRILRTRVAATRGLVTSACACAEVPEVTMPKPASTPAPRIEPPTVPMFPDRKMAAAHDDSFTG